MPLMDLLLLIDSIISATNGGGLGKGCGDVWSTAPC